MALDFGVGDIISSGINMYSANATAQKNIDWEKEKAQNYHQWEMEDYKKAGINPILTTGGHPSLGGANAQMPDTSGLGRAFEKALTAKKIENETKVANAEVENKNKDTELKEVQKENVATDTALKGGQTNLIGTQEKQTAQMTQTEIERTKIAKEQASREKERLENEINILKEEAEQAKTNTEKGEIEKEIKRKENKWFHVNQVLNGIGKLVGLGAGIAGGATARQIINKMSKKRDIKNPTNKVSQEVINYKKKHGLK